MRPTTRAERGGLAKAAANLNGPPALTVVLELEATPTVVVVTETAEDQARLLERLRRSNAIDELPSKIQAVLDRIDEEASGG